MPHYCSNRFCRSFPPLTDEGQAPRARCLNSAAQGLRLSKLKDKFQPLASRLLLPGLFRADQPLGDQLTAYWSELWPRFCEQCSNGRAPYAAIEQKGLPCDWNFAGQPMPKANKNLPPVQAPGTYRSPKAVSCLADRPRSDRLRSHTPQRRGTPYAARARWPRERTPPFK